MSRKSLHLLLLLISWTVSFAQTPGSNLALRDTNRCYTPTELKAIALKLINGAECDTLLKVANLTLIAQDKVVKSQKETIETQDIRYLETEHAVDECNTSKEAVKKELKKATRRLKWVKVGWAATAVAEAALVVYFMIH